MSDEMSVQTYETSWSIFCLSSRLKIKRVSKGREEALLHVLMLEAEDTHIEKNKEMPQHMNEESAYALSQRVTRTPGYHILGTSCLWSSAARVVIVEDVQTGAQFCVASETDWRDGVRLSLDHADPRLCPFPPKESDYVPS